MLHPPHSYRFLDFLCFSCFSNLWIISTFGPFLNMDLDSDNSTASAASLPSSAGKVQCCLFGRRMSSQTHGFHPLCTVCRGRGCDLDNRCDECIDIDDALMTVDVKHRHGLKHRVLSEQRII